MNIFAKKIVLIMALISLPVFANAQSSEDFSGKKTELIDEFPILAECDFSARIDNLFIHLMNNPESKGYIFLYRGAKSLPSEQSDEYLVRHESRIRNHINDRGYESSKIVYIDGGFVEGESFVHRMWLVPNGSKVPNDLKTVAKPELPENKSYLADKRSMYLEKALIEYTVSVAEEDTDSIEYNYTKEIYTLNESDNSEETIDSEEEAEIEDHYWVSDFFVEKLKENKKLSGIIFFYVNPENYNLGIAEEILQKNLQDYKIKNKTDLERIRLVYGGYRENPEVEFWIVPENSPDPQPSPEKKDSKQSK